MKVRHPSTLTLSLSTLLSKSSKSPLILPLTLALALTWMLSLRPLRLKIGDYYYNQGKYDQAVNWYGKVVRKNVFKVGHDESDRLKYEEDLTKFNSALVPSLEKKLINEVLLIDIGGHDEVY